MTTKPMRRDQVCPGMVFHSSAGFRVLVTEVQDPQADREYRDPERHVGLVGHMHANPKGKLHTERYSADSLVEVEVFTTATGQTGTDAYKFEAARLANELRELRKRMQQLTQAIMAEQPELKGSVRFAPGVESDEYPIGECAGIFTLSQVDDLLGILLSTPEKPYEWS